MDRPPKVVLQYLTELEMAAESVLVDKRQIIDLDARRQKTREAMRALQKDKSSAKAWMCVNNLMIKLQKEKVQTLLKKDFDQIDAEINLLRDGLRAKVDKMRDLESKDATKGFHLSPLTQQELYSLNDVL